MRHGLIHPATLILTFKGQTRKFNEPSEAEVYYKTVIELRNKNGEQHGLIKGQFNRRKNGWILQEFRLYEDNG